VHGSRYHEIRWIVEYRWMLGHVSGGSNIKCERISPSVCNALLHAIKVNCVRATRNLCFADPILVLLRPSTREKDQNERKLPPNHRRDAETAGKKKRLPG